MTLKYRACFPSFDLGPDDFLGSLGPDHFIAENRRQGREKETDSGTVRHSLSSLGATGSAGGQLGTELRGPDAQQAAIEPITLWTSASYVSAARHFE